MMYFVAGLLTMAAIWMIAGAIRRSGLSLKWWHWLLVGGGVLLLAFTLAVIAAFLEEGAVQGALVMGSLLAVITAVWFAGTGRILRKASRATPSVSSPSEKSGTEETDEGPPPEIPSV